MDNSTHMNSIKIPRAFDIRDGLRCDREYDITIRRIVNEGYRFPKGICNKIYAVYADYIWNKGNSENNDLYSKYMDLIKSELYPSYKYGCSKDKPSSKKKSHHKQGKY